MERKRNYETYLLRLWREDDGAPWRFTLKESHTGEQVSFGELKKLMDYLEERMKREDY